MDINLKIHEKSLKIPENFKFFIEFIGFFIEMDRKML